MKNWQKNYLIIAGLICMFGFHSLYLKSEVLSLNNQGYFFEKIQEVSERMYFPNLMFKKEQPGEINLQKQIAKKVMSMVPLGNYLVQMEKDEIVSEDEETYELLIKRQESDESAIDSGGNLIGEDHTTETLQVSVPNENLSVEKLSNMEYLVSHFYTVDSVTYLNDGDLDASKMLSMDMKIDETTDGPKVLIFHTHSQEAFADSDGTAATSIMGVGAYLTRLLTETYGIETIHHEGVYDLINGKLDRSEAYEQAAPQIKQILKQYPSIEVVIDLHRDGVKETTHLVTEIEGRQTAQIMFFNGMCRTRTNGDLTAMQNPYIKENLAFSMQMKIAAETFYPGFTRRNYIKGYKYNMDLMPKMLLIEAGAQTNTVEEVKNAMIPLAALLNYVLKQ